MVPEFSHDFTGMLLSMLWLALLTIGVLWPLMVVYAVRRFLKDFRRIADALEVRAAKPEPVPTWNNADDMAATEARERGIPYSAFGR